MKKIMLGMLLISLFVHQGRAMDGKTIGHLISIPIIEGSGIYTSVKMLGTHDANASAAAVTNLCLIGTNAGIGAYTLFGHPDNYGTLRLVHRITGFITSAASIWMAVSAVDSPDLKKVDKGVGVGYAVLTVVPLFVFSF
jgi:hypothetical protein